MTDPIEDSEIRQAREDEERRQARLRAKQFRKDVQEVLGTEAARRVLWAFLQTANADGSAYRENSQAMAHAVAWHDAAGWWIHNLRTHCPEREAQMRAEARRADKQELTDDE